jgi:hypothetical protein
MVAEREHFPVFLSIAGINIQVDCHNAMLASVLRERYAGFLAQTGEMLKLQIIPGLVGETVAFTPHEVMREKNVLRFKPIIDEDYVDFLAKKGQIKLRSSNPVEEIEYLLRVLFTYLALRSGGLMVHAAGIVHQGFGYAFLGTSGSGKSTVARFSTDDLVLNDDLIILLPKGERWFVHATPFTNPTQTLPWPSKAELKVMFYLEKDRLVSIERMSAARSFAIVMANLPIVGSSQFDIQRVVDLIEKLLVQIPLYMLHFALDKTFWRAIDEM